MSLSELKWKTDEKKVARAAFDKAYQTEVEEITNVLKEKVKNVTNDKDVWALHDYLSKRRRLVDEKYDLSLSRYKEDVYEEIVYETPKIILKKLKSFEKNIISELVELEGLIE